MREQIWEKTAKRKIFSELMEGVASTKAHREGKIALSSSKIAPSPLRKLNSK